MRLCFLMERHYAPYAKWFGSAFRRFACAVRLTPVLRAALAASSWHERERALSVAYQTVAEMHNALALTEPLDVRVSAYYGRPYLVIRAERFAAAIRGAIVDPEVKRLPPDLGSMNQLVDATDKLLDPALGQRLRALYGER